MRQHFTGYEHDGETGLDFAQARYYSSQYGRYTSPDPFAGSATIADPQTFNRYVYFGNNPVNGVDPSGMMSSPSGERASTAHAMSQEAAADIASDEAQCEDMVQYHFSGQAAFDRAMAAEEAAPSSSSDSSSESSSDSNSHSGGNDLAHASSAEAESPESDVRLQIAGRSGIKLSPSDHMKFPDGSRKLGPMSSKGLWGWKVEITAIVPDDRHNTKLLRPILKYYPSLH